MSHSSIRRNQGKSLLPSCTLLSAVVRGITEHCITDVQHMLERRRASTVCIPRPHDTATSCAAPAVACPRCTSGIQHGVENHPPPGREGLNASSRGARRACSDVGDGGGARESAGSTSVSRGFHEACGLREATPDGGDTAVRSGAPPAVLRRLWQGVLRPLRGVSRASDGRSSPDTPRGMGGNPPASPSSPAFLGRERRQRTASESGVRSKRVRREPNDAFSGVPQPPWVATFGRALLRWRDGLSSGFRAQRCRNEFEVLGTDACARVLRGAWHA